MHATFLRRQQRRATAQRLSVRAEAAWARIKLLMVRTGRAALLALAMLAAPANILVLCLLGGLASVAAGVFVLWGTGWALLAGGALLLCVAAILIRGLIRA